MNVTGTTVRVPFSEGWHVNDEILEISFLGRESALHVTITEEQAFELVRQLTDYLGKSTGAKFKRSLTKGKEVTF